MHQLMRSLRWLWMTMIPLFLAPHLLQILLRQSLPRLCLRPFQTHPLSRLSQQDPHPLSQFHPPSPLSSMPHVLISRQLGTAAYEQHLGVDAPTMKKS